MMIIRYINSMKAPDGSIPKKGRGRPRAPATAVIRLPVSAIETVDRWIAGQPEPKPTRTEAIERLIVKAAQ